MNVFLKDGFILTGCLEQFPVCDVCDSFRLKIKIIFVLILLNLQLTYLYFKLVQFLFCDSIGFGNDRDNIQFAVKCFHSHQI